MLKISCKVVQNKLYSFKVTEILMSNTQSFWEESFISEQNTIVGANDQIVK